MMEKRNVAEDIRTPFNELHREDKHWDKQAADEFKPVLIEVSVVPKPEVKAEVKS